MPIEVKELIIKATVKQESEQETAQPAPSAGSNEAVIAECVDQVLEILKEKMER